jgi:hypothetical protein
LTSWNPTPFAAFPFTFACLWICIALLDIHPL